MRGLEPAELRVPVGEPPLLRDDLDLQRLCATRRVQIGLAPWPAPAPCAVTSSSVPNTNSASTITELTVIQVAWIRVLPWIGGPSSSSPSRCRQTISA